MKRYLLFTLLSLCFLSVAVAQDPAAAERYQQQAEYYRRQAESYQNDAEYYLRQAKSAERDAEYYQRNKKYDRARDYYRRAADAMDSYKSKLSYARDYADKAKDYYRRAADALR